MINLWKTKKEEKTEAKTEQTFFIKMVLNWGDGKSYSCSNLILMSEKDNILNQCNEKLKKHAELANDTTKSHIALDIGVMRENIVCIPRLEFKESFCTH